MNVAEKYPHEFVKRINHQLATESEHFFNALNQTSPVSIRKHPIKGKSLSYIGESIPWCNQGMYLNERPVFTLDPLFHAGAYYVQEASSQFLDYLLNTLFPEKIDLNVLDLCAAPGGKSTLIASWLDGEGLLVSNEVIQSRIPVLIENSVKWGYANTIVTQNDATHFKKMENFFDVIVVDAPCSGEGLFRKDPDAINEWSVSNCTLCENRQHRILEDVLPALKTNGFLIYSTCTFNPGENDEVINWLCHEHGMEVKKIPTPDNWNIIQTSSGGYAFYPHKIKGEGFFCCVLRKIKESEINYTPSKNKKIEKQSKKIPVEIFNHLSPFISTDFKIKIIQNQEEWMALPETTYEAFLQLKNNLYIKHAGIPLGILKGRDFIPSAELPFYINFNNPYPSVELDKVHALKYLKKDSFTLNASTEKGWILMKYHDIPLGWIKNLGNRNNNYYPSHWKIRMEIPQ